MCYRCLAGSKPPKPPRPDDNVCPTCNGAKVIIDTSEDTDISPMKTCPACNGTGKA